MTSIIVKIMYVIISSIAGAAAFLSKKISCEDIRIAFMVDKIALCWCCGYWVTTYDFTATETAPQPWEFAVSIGPLFVSTIFVLIKIKR